MIRLLVFLFIVGISQVCGRTPKCKTHFNGVIDGKVGKITLKEVKCKSSSAACVALAYCKVRLADGKYEYGVASYCNGEAPSEIPDKFSYVCNPVRPGRYEFGCHHESHLSTERGYEISYQTCCQSCPDETACNNITISSLNPKCQQISSTTFAPLPTTKSVPRTTKSASRVDVIFVVLTIFSAVTFS
ncbi:hypothetical protein AB6A40_004420 [Gnathostoma spinigerum]|uniref:Uncharacterized protein n=1 Tax=Gnathostoma spinigerum TaxID=75299 RepID=A0ABD6EJW0_9BILA